MQQETNDVLESVTFRLVKFVEIHQTTHSQEYYLEVSKLTAVVKNNAQKIEYNVKEPVIRLFGRVTDSIDICVHIHNVDSI